MENQHRHIKGYRDLTQAEIDLMNEVKAEGERLEQLVYRVRAAIPEGLEADTARNPHRWASIVATDFQTGLIVATDFQTGLMALVRAVAVPETF